MPGQLITFGSRVTACDCLMVGRVNMVWKVGQCVPPARAKGEIPHSSSNPPSTLTKPTSGLRPPTSNNQPPYASG